MVTKGSVCFLSKVTIYVKCGLESGWTCEKCKESGWRCSNQDGNLGTGVEIEMT